ERAEPARARPPQPPLLHRTAVGRCGRVSGASPAGRGAGECPPGQSRSGAARRLSQGRPAVERAPHRPRALGALAARL
ncbi:MAG: hypothetical protein AVDCRST_MAG11-152, partial [uncultured Gemmatimonadaceae bacterium]